jgi:hypothetical protein
MHTHTTSPLAATRLPHLDASLLASPRAASGLLLLGRVLEHAPTPPPASALLLLRSGVLLQPYLFEHITTRRHSTHDAQPERCAVAPCGLRAGGLMPLPGSAAVCCLRALALVSLNMYAERRSLAAAARQSFQPSTRMAACRGVRSGCTQYAGGSPPACPCPVPGTGTRPPQSAAVPQCPAPRPPVQPPAGDSASACVLLYSQAQGQRLLLPQQHALPVLRFASWSWSLGAVGPAHARRLRCGAHREPRAPTPRLSRWRSRRVCGGLGGGIEGLPRDAIGGAQLTNPAASPPQFRFRCSNGSN